MKTLYGVTTAMVTPFDKNGEVDLNALGELASFLISKGVNGLYPTGTTGEFLRLSVSERKAVAKKVVDTVNQKATVFINIGAMCQQDTIELAKDAYRVGADGIGVVTPAFFSVNDREMEEYFVTVANSVPKDFPVYLYNIPQCSGNDLKAHVVQKVANRCPNVIGIKYSYPDALRLIEYLKVNDGKFSVVAGTDKLFNAALAMGCSGTISGVSCVYPEPFVAVYKAYLAGNFDEARKNQLIANKYIDTLKCGSNMSYFKEALKMRGVNAGHMKAPQLDLTAEEIAELKKQLEQI